MNIYRRSVILCLLLCFASVASAQNQPKVPAPSEFLGFQVGADRQLADYKQISSYLKKLAEVTPRVQVESLGQTTLGNDMIMAVISSAENLKNKARYKEIARKLADPRGMTQEQINALAREGKAILLVTCNIHSTEIGSSQMAMEWAHDLATANDAETKRRLDNVILLLVPSLNPDGQIMETEWYRKYVGTKYEGGRSPRLYHHYVGHDNNRDWYMLTQKETKNVSHMVYLDWKPMVWLDEHQMGSTGPRIFVPPDPDPIARRLHPMIFSGKNMIGTTMAFRFDEARKQGVVHSYLYDAYWPGATDGTAIFKNIFGMLIEVASAKMATPVEVESTELNGGGKGLIDYTKQANFTNPWRGGMWRLRDIMDYDRIASDALLETVANHREDYERGVARMAQDGIANYKANDYYRIPLAGQHDAYTAARLAHLIREHGVEVKITPDGSAFLVALAQPYGRFVDEMLSTHRYPEIRPAQGANILAPYDVTTWSLPLLMGVNVERTKLAPEQEKALRAVTDNDWPKGGVQGKGAVLAVVPEFNNGERLTNAALKAKSNVTISTAAFTADGREFPAGTLLLESNADNAKFTEQFHVPAVALGAKPQVKTAALRPLRVGLYKPYLASMDEGWTRFVLEQYGFDPISIENKAMRDGKLNEKFDVILLPDVTKEVIVDGKPKAGDTSMKYWVDLPPEFAGGIGKEGVQALKEFVEKGGTLISIADSGEFIADNFNLPVRNALAGVRPDDFNLPGSLLRIEVDTTHPLGYGMPEETAAFVEGPLAWQTSIPAADLKRYVVASYPEDSKDILISGWMKGEQRLERRSALVAFEQGKGKIVMFGFRPQYRAQTEGTYKLLFNAIRWAGME